MSWHWPYTSLGRSTQVNQYKEVDHQLSWSHLQRLDAFNIENKKVRWSTGCYKCIHLLNASFQTMLAGTKPLTLVVLLDHSLYFKLEKPVFCEGILLFLKLIIYITVCIARCVKVSSFGSLSHFTKINKVCGLFTGFPKQRNHHYLS